MKTAAYNRPVLVMSPLIAMLWVLAVLIEYASFDKYCCDAIYISGISLLL